MSLIIITKDLYELKFYLQKMFHFTQEAYFNLQNLSFKNYESINSCLNNSFDYFEKVKIFLYKSLVQYEFSFLYVYELTFLLKNCYELLSCWSNLFILLKSNLKTCSLNESPLQIYFDQYKNKFEIILDLMVEIDCKF